jgi:transcriptional regulator with XRE-family HTH domain
MSAREGPGDRGRRRGRRLLHDAIDEFHAARLRESITQERIARALDRSDAWVSWTESGQNEGVSVVQLSQLMACVGLELSVRVYPAGRGIRDDAQTVTLERFVSLVVPPWSWATEVPIPIPGDLRAWDGVLGGPCRIGVDAETRIRDLQAVDRRVMLKLRDSGLDRAIILVPDTRSNRVMLASTAQSLQPNYPIPGHLALDALRHGRDPGGNAIIVLPASVRASARSTRA